MSRGQSGRRGKHDVLTSVLALTNCPDVVLQVAAGSDQVELRHAADSGCVCAHVCVCVCVCVAHESFKVSNEKILLPKGLESTTFVTLVRVNVCAYVCVCVCV